MWYLFTFTVNILYLLAIVLKSSLIIYIVWFMEYIKTVRIDNIITETIKISVNMWNEPYQSDLPELSQHMVQDLTCRCVYSLNYLKAPVHSGIFWNSLYGALHIIVFDNFLLKEWCNWRGLADVRGVDFCERRTCGSEWG